MTKRLPFAGIVFGLALAGCRAPGGGVAGEAAPLAVLPFPTHVSTGRGMLTLSATLGCTVADSALRPLVAVLDDEYQRLAGGHVVESPAGTAAPCRLAIDRALGEEDYRLDVGRAVQLTGGSYGAVAMGSVTLLQLLEPRAAGGATVPRLTITDHPAVPFRAVLVDLGRQWHDAASLRQIVELARWYKIRYLQLHLTDDNIWTFPSRAYPQLTSPEQHYTVAELRALDDWARDRGVTIIPELEVPGHASLMAARRRDLFGFAGDTGWRATINMGREAVYAALDTLVGEIADVFRASPYLHMGGDEATLEPLATDADVKRYLAAHGLADVHELYRQFLVRMDSTVRRHGRQMIIWEGFRKEDNGIVPRDALVMAFETKYQLPQDILAGGYTVINTSWQPLYVVNERKWSPREIYAWNLWRWESWVPDAPSFHPIQLEPTPRIIGAMMCAWEQPQSAELPSLRLRLPAMSERIWNATMQPARPYAAFAGALARTDAKLDRLVGTAHESP